METLEDAFNKAIAELAASAKTEAELEAIGASVPEKLEEILNTLPNTILDSVKRDAYEGGLDEKRQLHHEFTERNYQRWKEGFDALELLVEICIEAGSDINKKLRPSAAANGDILFDTLKRLHAKGCLVAKEIVCLLRNGFADGAHSRWRALHEINVTANFLAKAGNDTAERYTLHEYVDSYKGACQHKKYEGRLQAIAPSDENISYLKAKYDEVISRFGTDFATPYGWAEHALGKKRANFSDLETAVALDHWRPYYKWASQNIHASAKTTKFSLGMSETNTDLLLVGSSDSGMTDPAHSMAISLAQATVNLLKISPNLDSIVTMKVIMSLSNEVGDLFFKAHKKKTT